MTPRSQQLAYVVSLIAIGGSLLLGIWHRAWR